MGTVNFGIPLAEALHLRDAMGLTAAVEGGTFRGDTARQLSRCFERVYTIERSPRMFALAKDRLRGLTNVRTLGGDTRTHLPDILTREDGILFWLDAHWSGGHTYGAGDECPLLAELQLIFAAGKRCAILVDDARLFAAPPPAPHDPAAWPALPDIAKLLPDGWDLVIWNDVIFLTPPDAHFRGYMQGRISRQHNADQRGLGGLLRRAQRRAIALVRKAGE